MTDFVTDHTLRLRQILAGNAGRVVAVTVDSEGAGRTAAGVNLATALTQQGMTVAGLDDGTVNERVDAH